MVTSAPLSEPTVLPASALLVPSRGARLFFFLRRGLGSLLQLSTRHGASTAVLSTFSGDSTASSEASSAPGARATRRHSSERHGALALSWPAPAPLRFFVASGMYMFTADLLRPAPAPLSAAATPLDWSGAPNNLVPEAWSAGEQAAALAGQPPAWAVDGPTASSMRSMAGEAAWRLRAACAGDEANEARREALRLVEGAAWPGFELPAADEPAAFVHHEPLQ